MILSIVTGTYNRLSHLKSMMESVRNSLPKNFVEGQDYEFCVCDGGSTDGTIEFLMQRSEVIKVVLHGELLGAIRAFNDAARAASGDYLLIANDDVVFNGLSVAKGIAFMQDRPDVGAGCFYQDRGGKEMHVESMGITKADGTMEWYPYIQIGLIPRWLWEKCGGWGDWGGRTYGGDNYISGRIYESGYKVVPIEGCSIQDKTLEDGLRVINNTDCKDGDILRAAFPVFQLPAAPLYPNPLPETRRVLYAPIIEAGHDIQKAQKRGLRDALSVMGLVWEVDYIYSRESIAEAAEAWKPHFILTQLHTADAITLEDVKRIKGACQGFMANWSGDVWSDAATPEFLERLRSFDVQLTVNAALIPVYENVGIKAVYLQNSFEPQVIEDNLIEEPCDIVFLGNNYTESRGDLVRFLTSLHFNTSIYGRGYPPEIVEGESLYDYRKSGQIYRGAQIGIADNQYFTATGFASDRMFMILAAGDCLMMHQRVDKMEELLGLVDGFHYVAWDTLEDLKQKIDYYLTHEDDRKRIAAAGTEECRNNHSFAARVNQLQGIIKSLPKKKDTISAMMIVKNEATRIEACIEQLKQFADEIIIVDTGSTDGTIDILNNLEPTGIGIFHYKWNDDFAAARNFAKSKCTKDWIFWMDGDDFLPELTISNLQRFPWSKRSAGIFNPGAHRLSVVAKYGKTLGASCFQPRMIRNIPALQWRSPIHETLDNSLQELGVKVVTWDGLQVHHIMPDNPFVFTQKQQRNVRILKTAPDSAWKFMQIASSFMGLELFPEALLYLRKSNDHFNFMTRDLELKNMVFYMIGVCYSQIDEDFAEEAEKHFRQSDHPDAIFKMAQITEKNGGNASEFYQKVLDAQPPQSYQSMLHINRPKAVAWMIDYHSRKLKELMA